MTNLSAKNRPTPGRGIRALAQNLLIVLGALLVVVGCLELLLRTTHLFGARVSWSIADPKIGWRHKPNVDYWYDSKEHPDPITGTINNFGWNNDNWSIAKPTDTFRVAILGDSYVEGLQVQRNANFVTLTETALNDAMAARGRRVELMNFGRSGFTQTEEWVVLNTDVLRFAPDLVVLFYFAPNDIMDMAAETTLSPDRPYPVFSESGELALDTDFNRSIFYRIRALVGPVKNRSALVSLFAERMQYLLVRRAAKAVETIRQPGERERDRTLSGYLSLATATPDPLYVENYRASRLIVAEMRASCWARGVDFLLAVIDTPDYIPQVEAELKDIDASFEQGFFARDLAEFARVIEVDFLDLQKIFRLYYQRHGRVLHFGRQYRENDEAAVVNLDQHSGHWNYTGHEVVADALTTKIFSIVANHGPSGD